MDKKFHLIINSRDLEIDTGSIEFLFGCNGTVSDCYDHETKKFAFYNTGQLCQVSYENGSRYMKIEVLTGCDSRKEDILGWLKIYLQNGMKEYGYHTDFIDYNGFSFAKFSEITDNAE